MSLFARHWEPDGRDSLSPSGRLILSIVVTGVVGFLLEFIGIEVLGVFDNSAPGTLYIVTGIWAFGLGPVIHALRRSSMLIPMAIVGGLFAVLVLFNHYSFIEWAFVPGEGFREIGLRSPRIWEFRDGQLLGIRHPLLIALVAGIIETVVVPVSIFLQRLVTIGRVPQQPVPLSEVEETFKSSVGSPDELKVKHDFGFHFMRFIFFAYGIYFVYMIIGLLVNGHTLPVVDMFFINSPETVNSVMKLTLMISMANLAAFNRDVRREAATLLFIGHGISVGASLALYFAYPVNPIFPNEQGFLLSSVLGDGILLIVLVYYMVKPRPERLDLWHMEDVELRSPASTVMRAYFLIFASLFTAFTLAIVYFRTMGDPEAGLGAVFGGPDPLVSNSLTKYGTLAAIGWFLFARPRLRKYFVPTLILAFSFSIVATIYYGLQGTTVLISRLGTEVELPWFMTQHIIVDGGGLLLLLAIRRWQYNVDFQISALSPGSAECVLLLHHAFRESSQNPADSAFETLRRIDDQVGTMRGRRRGMVGFPFWIVERFSPTLCGLRPTFSTMSREEARWTMRRYFLRPRYERARALSAELADLLSSIGDIVHALLTLAYFSGSQGQAQVGYVLPDARARLQPDIPTERPPDGAEPLPLPKNQDDPVGRKPATPEAEQSRLLAPRLGSRAAATGALSVPDEVDYCIIGSGAGGAVLAYRIAQARGGRDSICVLERGGYYAPREDFTDDEMQMIRTLYADGGLQTTRSFDFTILQGECVGGTTVINNAVCFRMPEVSRGEWESYGIEMEDLNPHYDRVAQEINIETVKPNAVNRRVEELLTTHGTDAFVVAGGRLSALAVGDTPWEPEQIESMLRQQKHSTAYLISDFHNPTAAVMDDATRSAVAASFRRHGVTAVIDESLRDINLDGIDMPPHFAHYDPNAILLGSSSKLYWGGLRVGWIRSPRPLLGSFIQARMIDDLGSSAFDQLVLAELFDDGGQTAAASRARGRASRDHLLGELAHTIPEIEAPCPPGGLNLWVTLPQRISSQVVTAAAPHGLLLTPGPRFFTSAPSAGERHLRLPFTLSHKQLTEAVHRLRVSIDDVLQGVQPRTVTTTPDRLDLIA